MSDIDKAIVKQFNVRSVNDGQDTASIYLGPEQGLICTTKWPMVDGIVAGVGQSQTIVISRAALIGLAYEILQNVKDTA
jgi:hypothetical protein